MNCAAHIIATAALTALALAGTRPAQAQYTANQVFNYTGADQTFVVPQQDTSIFVELWGAGGEVGAGVGGVNGGGGAFVSGYLSVTPGSMLTLVVGQGGSQITNFPIGLPAGDFFNFGGGGAGNGFGGGRSAILLGTTEIVDAGGGGGGGSYVGGGGGIATGSAAGGHFGGGGGTQNSGGSGGFGNTWAGPNGSQFYGGSNYYGPPGEGWWPSGGGGGGYYGGGAGGSSFSNGFFEGGGGGGSSYTSNALFTDAGNDASAQPNGTPGGINQPFYESGVDVGYGGSLSNTLDGNGGNGEIEITYSVPAPGSLPLFACGMSAIGFLVRRRMTSCRR